MYTINTSVRMIVLVVGGESDIQLYRECSSLLNKNICIMGKVLKLIC